MFKTAAVTSTAARAGSHIRAANATADMCSWFTASKFVKFDTGSNKLAVFASHTAAIANGTGGNSSRSASASTTGVSRTAVVSRLNTMVVTVPSTSTSPNSRRV